MPRNFHGAKLKIERAHKHIGDLNSLLTDFVGGNFYTLSVERDAHTGVNYLKFTFAWDFPIDSAAVIIGDALHNLRSALDLLYFGMVTNVGGVPSKYTRFPIRDRQEELKDTLDTALKKQQITAAIHDFILNTVKPYQAGNYPLWGLDDLNIRDKHQLLIPVFKLMQITDIGLEDDKGAVLDDGSIAYFMDGSSRVRIEGANDRNVILKKQGHATATIIFGLETTFRGEAIIPSLNAVAEEVSRTVEAFEVLCFRKKA